MVGRVKVKWVKVGTWVEKAQVIYPTLFSATYLTLLSLN
jgi:hypothetical protein